MPSPHCGESAQATWSLDISDEADDHDGRGFDNGHCLDNFLLVQLGTRTVHIANDMCHTSLVAKECGEVAWLGGIVLGEAPDLTKVLPGTLPWQKAKITVTWPFELTMGHGVEVSLVNALSSISSF